MPESTPAFDSAILHAEKIYDSGKKRDALNYIINVRQTSRDLTAQDQLKYLSYCNTIYMKDLKDYDKCMAIADSMLQVLDKAGLSQVMSVRVVEAINIKADALMAKGLYSEAYDNYFKAKTLAKNSSDSCSVGAYSYSLGMVTFRMQKYKDAASHFKQAFAETHFCKDDFTFFCKRQEILDNVGLCYDRLQQYDSAVLYYNKAINFINQNVAKFPTRDTNVFVVCKAVVYGNLADVYIALKQFDTATSLLEKSIAINIHKAFEPNDAELSQIKLARLYLTTRNVPQLKVVLNEIRAELDTLPNRLVEMQWNKLMWQFYAQEGDSLKASRYVINYIVASDSLNDRNKSLMESDVEGKIKSLEHSNEITLLEKNKKQQSV